MATTTWIISNDTFTIGSTLSGFYKMGNYTNEVPLQELDAGTNGFMRASITTGGVLKVVWNAIAHSETFLSTFVMTAGTWYFLQWTALGVGGGSGKLSLGTRVIEPGNIVHSDTSGTQFTATAGNYAANLSIGHFNTIAGINDFPNSPGLFEQKGMYSIDASNLPGNHFLTSAPAVDQSGTLYNYLYLCRQTVGPIATLTDSSPNALTLTAGSGGMTINGDGPYP